MPIHTTEESPGGRKARGLAGVFGAGLQGGITLAPRQRKVLGRILACANGSLGARVYRCEQCGGVHSQPHSCRDRHCPRCQRSRAEEWKRRQQEALLPVAYFHVVFTLPHQLNALIRQNPGACLELLFKSASSTLLDFGRRNLGATLGLTAVLHTWGQTMCEHYHLHVLVTGGGLALSEDEWIAPRSCDTEARSRRSVPFLFATRALSQVFQARYLKGLEHLHAERKLEFHGTIKHWQECGALSGQLRTLSRRRWCVYAKAPLAGPSQVLGYLSLYTHRVAISEGRLREIDAKNNTVSFYYKDYADGEKRKTMTLSCAEFTRRFCQHILPGGFCKIRHYGILSTRNRTAKVSLCRILLGGGERAAGSLERDNSVVQPPPCEAAAEAPAGKVCPHCGASGLKLILIILPRGKPETPRRLMEAEARKPP